MTASCRSVPALVEPRWGLLAEVSTVKTVAGSSLLSGRT
jgi:hypothetical protein